MSGSTEDFVLNSIPGLEDASTDTSGDTGSNTPSTTTEQTGVGTAGQAGQQQSAKPTDGATQQSGGTDAAQTRRDNRSNGAVTTDKAGNIVDPVTGQLVATAGIAARFYKDAEKSRTRLADVNAELANVKQQLQQMNEVTAFARTQNLTPQAQLAGMKLIAEFGNNPLQVIKDLATHAQAQGHDLSSVFGQQAGGINLDAIKQMMENYLAPFNEDRISAQQARQQQIDQQNGVKAELDNFIDAYPDAEIHLGTLGNLVQTAAQQGQRLSLGDAYTKMVVWASRNGLDLTQDIPTQVAARQGARATGASTDPRTQGTTNGAPLPFGRTGGQSNSETPVTQAAGFNENSSFNDIIRHAMRTNGYDNF